MAEADVTNAPILMSQLQQCEDLPLVDPNILKDKRVNLVRDLNVEAVLACLKPFLHYAHVAAINAETNGEDKTRKLCDILQRISCTKYGVFNTFLRLVGGVQPDLFLELVGRAPSEEEADFCVEKYTQSLKECIKSQGHSPDSPLDEKIDFDCEHVELAIKRDNQGFQVSHDLPHRYRSHLSDVHEEVPAVQVLDSAENENPPRRVSVYGRAGTGKTTTFQWLAREWSFNRWATQFTFLFLIQLRMMSDSQMTAIELLTLGGLYQVGDARLVQHLLSWLQHAAGRVLIMIDGLDEVAGFTARLKNCPKICDLNQKAHAIDLCLNILSGNLLSGCTVITASRPFTGLTIVKFDKRFEILGLTESRVKDFVKCKHPSKVPEIMEVLNNCPLLMSVCTITFYCALISRLLAEGVVFTNEDLKTYSRLMSFLIVQCVERRFSDWCFVIQVSSYFHKLAKMAYIGVFDQQLKGEMSKLVFNHYDLSQAKLTPLELKSIQDVGLLQMRKMKVGLRQSVIAEFLDFSIQEMLASAYLLSDVPSTDFLKQVFSDGQFNMALLYLFGLQYDTGSEWINDIRHSVNQSGQSHCLEKQMNDFIHDLSERCCNQSDFTSQLQLCQLLYEGQMEDKARDAVKCIMPHGKLSIKDTPMTLIDFMAVIFVCKQADTITEVSLTNCGLTDTLLGSLTCSLLQGSVEKLSVLKLRANALCTAKAIAEWLKQNDTLNTLDLIGNNIDENGAAAIAEALQTNKTLQALDVGRNKIGENGAKAIAAALQNDTLETLSVGYNNIGENGVTAIATALQKNTKLGTLFVNNNNIGDNGATAIAATLHHNDSLHTIYVNTNNIAVKGARAIAKALQTNHKLQTLVVWGNDIGDDGATAIAAALETNRTVQTLDIRGCNIGDHGATALAGTLQMNSTIQTLYADHNNIGDDGAIALAAGLHVNSGLQVLDVRYNRIHDIGLTTLQGVSGLTIKSDSQQ